jgi:hypothetical protein
MRSSNRLALLICTGGITCIAGVTGGGWPQPLAAASPQSTDLPISYIFTPSGHLSPLRSDATYRASEFPIPIRLTPPAPGWSGVQWKSGTEYFHGGGPPNYGWIHLARGPATAVPQGLISIMTAYGRTPSVAATVNVLRTRGRGATYEAASPVTLAGFSGLQFDGQVVGAKNVDHVGHFFVPFSPRSHSAKYYPDEYPVYGDAFHIAVLDVRGRTVVIYVENVALPSDRFPAFLQQADAILRSLRFPRGG